jgi:hypothetical protein
VGFAASRRCVRKPPSCTRRKRGREITFTYLASAERVLGGPGFSYVGGWRYDNGAVLEFEASSDVDRRSGIGAALTHVVEGAARQSDKSLLDEHREQRCGGVQKSGRHHDLVDRDAERGGVLDQPFPKGGNPGHAHLLYPHFDFRRQLGKFRMGQAAEIELV